MTMELHKCVFLLHKYYFVGGYSYLVVFRVMKMAGEEGTLTKENFIKILRSSDLFLKAFDKNKDGIVTEVCNYFYIDTFTCFTSLITFFQFFIFPLATICVFPYSIRIWIYQFYYDHADGVS